jgi:class 3 adenylate cyclase
MSGAVILPETKYASVGNDRVAYQVFGKGKRDLVHVTGLCSDVDVAWEEPTVARFLRRLGSFSRLIRFDRRSSGLSDPRPEDGRPEAEHWQEDLLTVLDTVHSEAPYMLCQLDGGPLALGFVHAHPERCSGLILVNTTARYLEAPDYPQGHRLKDAERFFAFIRKNWGNERFCEILVPSQAKNEPIRRWISRWCRAVASPRTVASNLEAIAKLDARRVLPEIGIPTLVMTGADHSVFPVAQGRYLADNIPGASFVQLPGADSFLIWEAPDATLDRIKEFVTGERGSAESERTVATVMFTDIVKSTERAAELGDAAWRELLDRHDRIVREQLSAFHGRLVDSAGDGTLAVFDSPRFAIDCAFALISALRELRIEIRAGLHIGELELREDGRVGGMAVHIGARVLGWAKGGEILVSRTLRDILIGSRVQFRERGIHELKGVPSKWPLYAVRPAKRK